MPYSMNVVRVKYYTVNQHYIRHFTLMPAGGEAQCFLLNKKMF